MKKLFKQKLAMILCVCMIFSTFGSSMFTHAVSGGTYDFNAMSVGTASNTKPKEDYTTSTDSNSSGGGKGSTKEYLTATTSNTDKLLTYSETIDGVVVTIKAEYGILPEGVEVSIKKVETEQKKEIEDKLKQDNNDGNKNIEDVFAADITFYHGEEEVQPDGLVDVSFEILENKQADHEFEIFHVEKETGDIDKVNFEQTEEKVLSCSVDNFSVYGIVQYSINYIEIFTVQDLIDVKKKTNANYKLMNDIDLADMNWEPIRGNSTYFSGIFDGNGKTIYNMTIWPNNDENNSYVGLFFRVRGTAEIKDLNFENVDISSENHFTNVGVIVGGAYEPDSDPGRSKIKNCHASNVTIDIKHSESGLTIGGLVGSSSGDIIECSFEGEIFSEAYGISAGGIIGATDGNIEKCKSSANITAIYQNTNNYVEDLFVGGIVGLASRESAIIQSVNAGDLFAGIKPDNNQWKVRVSCGGIAGSGYGTIEDAYNAGQIEVYVESNIPLATQVTIGGIVGLFTPYYTSITHCYNIGNIKHNAQYDGEYELIHIGGIVGRIYYGIDPIIRENYYCNTNLNGIGTVSKGNNAYINQPIYYSSTDMRLKEKFIGFDFENVWMMGDENYPYPMFQGTIWEEAFDNLQLVSVSPYAGETRVWKGRDIVLQFNNPICNWYDLTSRLSDGNIYIKEYDTDKIVYQGDISKDCVISDCELRLRNATNNVEYGKDYYICISPDLIYDSEGLEAYAGTSGKEYWFKAYEVYLFENIASDFGSTYQISDIYLEIIKKNMKNSTYRNIIKEMEGEWKGSCFGMASVWILYHQNMLSVREWTNGTNYLSELVAPINNNDTRDLINLHQLSQNFSELEKVVNAPVSLFKKFSNDYDNVKNLVEACKANSPTLFTIQYEREGKDGVLGHALVAIGIDDYGDNNSNSSGFNYRYRIHIVDINYKYVRYLYVSDNYEWKYGSYKLDKNGREIKRIRGIVTDSNILKLDNIKEGADQIIAIRSHDTQRLTIEAFGQQLRIDPDYILTNGTIGVGDLDCTYNIPITEGSDSKKINIFLDESVPYKVYSSDSLNVSCEYENYLLEAVSNTLNAVDFNPNGSVSIDSSAGENEKYLVGITLNNEKQNIPWSTFIVEGNSKTEDITLSDNNNGVILATNNMNNIVITASNGEIEEVLLFSTTYDSILITSSKNEANIEIYVDTNNDGTYETKIKDSQNSNNNSTSSGGSGGSGGGTSSSKTTISQVIDGTNYTWKQNETGWWLENASGSYPTNAWVLKDNIYYWFRADGYMVTQWNFINNKWYYFHDSGAMMYNAWLLHNNYWYFFTSDGAMKTGWLEWNDKYYYFDSTGAMLTNTYTPDGYYVNENGEWVK